MTNMAPMDSKAEWAVARLALVFLAVFSGAFLLFGSGWASEVAKDDYPLSWALSRERMHFPEYYQVELNGVKWLIDHRDETKEIYYDDSAEMSFAYYTPVEMMSFGYFGIGRRFGIYLETPEEFGSIPVGIPEGLEPNSYIYLRDINLRSQELTVLVVAHKMLTVPEVMPLAELPTYESAIDNANIIYNNGGSEVRLMR